jgi:uncharacterized paraquat-inducible protein A
MNKSTFSTATLCAWCGAAIQLPADHVEDLLDMASAALCPPCEEQIASGEVSWPVKMEHNK